MLWLFLALLVGGVIIWRLLTYPGASRLSGLTDEFQGQYGKRKGTFVFVVIIALALIGWGFVLGLFR